MTHLEKLDILDDQAMDTGVEVQVVHHIQKESKGLVW